MKAAAAALFALAGLTSAVAEAQGCAEGRIQTIEGYCCWPAQTWSHEHQRCEGPPACPSGMVADGDDCVAPATPPPATIPPVSPPSGSTVTTPPRYGQGSWRGAGPQPPARWESTPAPPTRWESTPAAPTLDLSPALAGTAWPESSVAPGATNPRRERRLDNTLFTMGVGILGAGYVPSFIGAVLAFEHRGIYTGGPGGPDSTCHDTAGALFLVPVVGALAGAIAHGSCSVPVYREHIGVLFLTDDRQGAFNEPGYWALALASTAVQLAGGIMALVALLAPPTVTVYDPPPSVRVSLLPHASPTSAGATLEVRWL